MKPIFPCILFLICVFSDCQAQNPLVKMWDYRYGGASTDYHHSIQQTSDNGYIVAGNSDANMSGDKTQNSWGYFDYWIVKTDSSGNKLWDKDFGGTQEDYCYAIQQTNDGGYILGGSSGSDISGDKTQMLCAPNGNLDYWILKTDSIGNKLWDKAFGGTWSDHLYSLQLTSDRGFILGGASYSGISCDKTQANWDPSLSTYDYWIVKTDSLGNKLWDKDFGGASNDILATILPTFDGGYILGGRSYSSIGGNKTQNTQGDYDYWIVKIDSLGNKEWDKDFGGILADELDVIHQTADGGYLLCGSSYSNISGDKTQANWDPSGNTLDYWIVKTDWLGNKQWDKDFGGTDHDALSTIQQTPDSGFILGGSSKSSLSGDKTENNLGTWQPWIIKTDSLFNKQWDKTIFTPGFSSGSVLQTKDQCYLISGSNDGGIGGYKTQSSQGSYDYWIVKFCDSTFSANFISTRFLCPGSCIDFHNLSTNAISYQWIFPGAAPNTSTSTNPSNICYYNPGTYSVTLIATNSNGSDTLTLQNYITVFPQPLAQSITQSGDTLFAIAGSASYQWYFNGNIISGATNYFHVAQSSGDYNVIATNTNGCEVEAVINNVMAAVGSPDSYRDMQSIQIYPNPVTDKLTIQKLQVTRGTAVEISVYNVFGEKINLVVSGGPLTVDCRPLSPGIYYIEITTNNKTFRSKFLKQ